VDDQFAACVVPAERESGPRSAGALTAENVDPGERPGMIFDELERVEFKLARHGVRSDLARDPVPLKSTMDCFVPARASRRRHAGRPVQLEDLAALLEYLRSHEGEAMPKYAYASAGNSYAVQTYLHVADGKVDGLPGGTYYHDPAGHRLLPIHPGATLSDAVRFGTDQHSLDTAAFTLYFVVTMDAIRPLYGRRAARDLALIESGLIAQLLEDHAAAHRIGLCQLTVVGGEDSLRESFELGDEHEVLHAMLGGALLREGEPPAVPPDRTTALAAGIRERLADRLPGYMVPGQLVVTENLPLTPTGKVDRGAVERLVAPEPEPPDTGAPADELEATIARIFREVLAIDAVGVHTGFFELGADSTAIVRAYRLLRGELDQQFPLTAMFEHASVRKLAAALSGKDTENREDLLVSAARRAGQAKAARRRRTRPSPKEAP